MSMSRGHTLTWKCSTTTEKVESLDGFGTQGSREKSHAIFGFDAVLKDSHLRAESLGSPQIPKIKIRAHQVSFHFVISMITVPFNRVIESDIWSERFSFPVNATTAISQVTFGGAG